MFFFKREGFVLDTNQKKDMEGMFDKHKLIPVERELIKNSFKDTRTGSAPVKYKAKLMDLYTKHPKIVTDLQTFSSKWGFA
jgi:hypothetical protein